VPTYSYRCTACETAFDIHQAFTEDSLTVCPTCGGALRKVFSAVGVTFSGSGFYSSDNRASEKKSSSSTTSSATPAPSTPAAAPAATPAPAAGSAS
jgi:putative FmdB family regulatory protein